MRVRVRWFLLVIVVSVPLGGCRGDGPMPVMDDEASNRIGDISRDLISVAGGDAQARQDLTEDLSVLAESAAVRPVVEEFARRVSEAVAGKALNDENARVLAQDLWTTASARELSERQAEALRSDVQSHLVSMGVPEGNAQNVAEQVLALQQVVRRPSRWYEFF